MIFHRCADFTRDRERVMILAEIKFKFQEEKCTVEKNLFLSRILTVSLSLSIKSGEKASYRIQAKFIAISNKYFNIFVGCK